MFVPKAAQFPARVQLRGEVENILIEKRVSHLHRRVHGHTISLRLQQVPGERHPCAHPQPTVQRMPLLCPLHIHPEAAPRTIIGQHFPHRRSVKAELRQREDAVGIYPRIGPADGIFEATPKLGRILRNLAHPKKCAASCVAQPKPRNGVQRTEQFCDFIPRVASQPLIRALAGEHHFLPALMDSPRELEQRGA